jgi:hypothetical protein
MNGMLSLLTAGLALFQGMSFYPTDDVWVYAHATDPTGDHFMRVWGIDGEAVPSSAADSESFSMGYMKFSLTGIPKGATIKSAKLLVHQAPSPGYTVEESKAYPLEARLISTKFTEKGWNDEVLSTVLPKASDLLGFGSPESVSGDTISITIDLKDHLDAVNKAASEGELGIALTSTIDAETLGRSAVYKIYSREEPDPALAPKLLIELDPQKSREE